MPANHQEFRATFSAPEFPEPIRATSYARPQVLEALGAKLSGPAGFEFHRLVFSIRRKKLSRYLSDTVTETSADGRYTLTIEHLPQD